MMSTGSWSCKRPRSAAKRRVCPSVGSHLRARCHFTNEQVLPVRGLYAEASPSCPRTAVAG